MGMRLLDCTEEWLLTFGGHDGAAAVIGRTLPELATLPTAERLRTEIWPALLIGGVLRGVELQLVRPPCSAGAESAVVEVATDFRLVRDAEARPLHVLAAMSNVTARNAELRQHRLALEAARMGTWCWELAAQEIAATEGARALLGLSPREPLDYRRLLQAVHPEDRDRVDCTLRRSLAERHDCELEHRCLLADGTERWVHTRGGAQWDDAGRLVRLHGVVIDVTARHHAEEQLRQAQRMEAVGQLAAGLTHDFKNLVLAMRAGAHLVERHADDARKVRSLAHTLDEAAGRGEVLARRMLDFSRRDHGSAAGEDAEQAIDPAEAVAAACRFLARTMGARHRLRHDIQVAGLPALVCGNRDGLERLLIDLVVNARDAMPDGGDVVVRVAAERVPEDRMSGRARTVAGPAPGFYARISVQDKGLGMPPEVLARAGEAFFTTKPRGQGTGLGLSSARGFAERAGGVLGIESDVGRGTTVTVWLPAAA
jgi:PAS domain S-box-containing protein